MRLGKLRMLLEDRDREVDDLRSLLADREGRIQQLVQDLHQRHDGGEGVFLAAGHCNGPKEAVQETHMLSECCCPHWTWEGACIPGSSAGAVDFWQRGSSVQGGSADDAGW